MVKMAEKKFKELEQQFPRKKKKKNIVKYNISAQKRGKNPLVVQGGIQGNIPITKNLTITPKISQTKARGKTVQKKRGLAARYKDVSLEGNITKTPYSPNRKEIKLNIDKLLGGKLGASASKQGKNKQGNIDFKIPLKEIPIIKNLFGYSKGGQIKRPKGVKIAQRGFGRAIKNGK